MKPLIVTVLLLFSGGLQAQPALGNNEAAALISTALRAEPLMWLPFPLPYELDRTRQDRDSVYLDALFRHGLVTREAEIRMADVLEEGRQRRKAQALWIYRYYEGRDADTPEGFYYGRAKLVRIVELSRPYLVGEFYYAEAYIQWAAVDLEPWIQDPAFRTARTIRRSLESVQKPFEKRVYLQHNGEAWGFWKGQPGQL